VWISVRCGATLKVLATVSLGAASTQRPQRRAAVRRAPEVFSINAEELADWGNLCCQPGSRRPVGGHGQLRELDAATAASARRRGWASCRPQRVWSGENLVGEWLLATSAALRGTET
jgi:hypothetical protein